MKLFIVLASVSALAAANQDTLWDRWQGRGRGERTNWSGERGMGDTGIDDNIRVTKNDRNIFDRLTGINRWDRDERMDSMGRDSYETINNRRMENLRDNSMEMNINRDNLRNRVRTVDNLDKNLVKHDDDVKFKILGDRDLLYKQKFVLDVLVNVHRVRDDKDDITRDVRIVDGENYYKNYEKVTDFFRMLRDKRTLLPRGRVFTINDKVHRKQLRNLFNLFFYSKDFNVFQRNVLWARRFINEEMFVHALIAAILHRDDMTGVKVPALYEILPHKFHTSMTIDRALKNKDILLRKDYLIIFNKYTKDYNMMNEEGRLAYLMEDIGWNLYHYFFHMEFASFVGGKDFNLFKERRGEKYWFFIQQILARYNLERLSNGLGNIKDISQWTRIKTGYNPMMINKNGLPVTMRRNYYEIRSTEDFYLMKRVDDYARRIRDAIDKGYCVTFDGGNVDLKRSDAIDILGNMIQNNIDSVNTRYYGTLVRDFAKLLGGGHIKDIDRFRLTPSVMEHHETALRDPVTYQLYKKIMKLYYQFKDTLPSYRREDLNLDGVRVDNVRTSRLMTYFDTFDVDIGTIVDTDNLRFRDGDAGNRGGEHINNIDNKRVIARHMRLNHKPFVMNIDLTVDRPQKVVVRTFLGPKFDNDNKLFKLRYNRDNFFQIDKFTHDLTNTGKVNIQRHSRDFVYTVRDRTTVFDMYKRVLLNKDVDKLVNMHVDEANCGFPDRLLLPRGWVGGMPLQLFVIVTKAKDIVKRDRDHTIICGKRTLINEVDDFNLGFPFDRRIDEAEFNTRNMFFKDVLVFHDDRLEMMLNKVNLDVDNVNNIDIWDKLTVMDNRSGEVDRMDMDMDRMDRVRMTRI